MRDAADRFPMFTTLLHSTRLRFVAALVAVLPTAACGPDRPPSIVLISIDTLRSDRLPAYGYDRIDTPAVDRLSADGILFESAWAHVPLTFPSHASLFTGLLPNRHGVRDNLGYTLPTDRLAYLPRRLADRGYRTAAFVSSRALAAGNGLETGFEVYDDRFETTGARSVGEAQRDGGATVARAIDWLQSTAKNGDGGPLFLFVHLYDPHSPWDPPEPWASRTDDPYDGEILVADAAVGNLLTALDEAGLYRDAAIVLTSDHGEGLGDHGEIEHGILLYREALQVPLILKRPGNVDAGRTVSTPVQTIDLFSTLADLAGVRHDDVPQPPAGRRVVLHRLGSEVPSRPIYSETLYPRQLFGWSQLVSVVRDRHHWIEGAARELFDLESDPAEQNDLFARERRLGAELADLAAQYELRIESTTEADVERIRELQSLGYLMGGATPDDGELLDPKTQIHRLEDLRRGMEAFARGEFVAAEAALRPATREHPELVGAWQNLATAIARQGRTDEAVAIYRESLERTDRSPVLALAGGELLVSAGRFDEALEIVTESMSQHPTSRELSSLEVRLLLALDRVDAARRRADEILEQHDDATARYDRALVARVTGDLGRAEAELRRALELDPRHLDGLNDLAVLTADRGDLTEAIALTQRALAIAPGHPLATENLRAFQAQAAGR